MTQRRKLRSSDLKSLSREQRITALVAAVLLITGTLYLSVNFSLAPLVIVGVPGALAYLLWYVTYLKSPVDQGAVLPAFLLAVAGFTLHSIEEYLGHYGPAVGRMFNLPGRIKNLSSLSLFLSEHSVWCRQGCTIE
jgi:hypothetical protein